MLIYRSNKTELVKYVKDKEEYFQNVDDTDYYNYALNKKVYEYLSTIVTLNEK